MRLGMIISDSDPETVFNAFRLANLALSQGDDVRVFLLGRGVELDTIEDQRFAVREQADAFLSGGGQILACGTCLKLRNSANSELCPLSTMKDLHDLIESSDRVVTF